MKPILEYLPPNFGESFVAKSFDYDYYPTPWHFHPEYELVLVTESTGKRFIGDHISDFESGDLALLGPYLPHTYRNDPPYLKDNAGLRAKSIVVHFKEDSLGGNLLLLPEAHKIKSLLARSIKGIAITGKTNATVSKLMHRLVEATGFKRVLILLEILSVLSESEDLSSISNNTIIGQNDREASRMNKVINFVIASFHTQITLSHVAEMVNMAENSFSRYFSQRTRKSFTGFVNEVRLNHASRLLIETNKSVTEICMECGFNNLSNFNRQFRKVYSVNPVSFRRLYINHH